jgi:vitamin B12 transporter
LAAAALRVSDPAPASTTWSARGVRLEIRLIRFHPSPLARAAACLFLFSSALHAQTIVVTGVREPLAADRLAADVVVIDEATIRNSRADSLADLLRREAGVQLSRTGGPGHGTGLFIRGANSGQTVVLVDGVRIGSATLGQPFFDGLALSGIERIEVLRGPGSSIYGADAVGGVVQVFTRRGDAVNRFDAQAAAGGYDSLDAAVGGSGRNGRWDLAASASHEQSDGVSTLRPGDVFGNYNPDADGYRLSAAQAQIGFRPADGHRVALSLLRSHSNAQYDSSEYLPPSYAQDNTPDFRDRLDTVVTTLDWRGPLAPGLTGSARLSSSIDELESGGSVTDRYRTERRAATAQLAWAAGALGEMTGAVDYTLDRARSSAYLEDAERRTTAVVLALTGSAAGWSWQGDLRHDDSSDFGGATTARLGGGVTLAPGWRLRALAGTTFRAPSFNDLYYPGYGVPTLQPEEGRSVEAGLDWKREGSDASLTLYRNRVSDLIGYESDRSYCPPDPSYDYGCARNIRNATLAGATLSARHRVDALALKAQFDWLDATDDDTGARLARRASRQATLGADWAAGPWSLGASVLYLGERPDAGKELAAETTLDLGAQWRFAKGWTLQAKLLNATNRETEPARDYQGLGRQAWLGLRFEGGL